MPPFCFHGRRRDVEALWDQLRVHFFSTWSADKLLDYLVTIIYIIVRVVPSIFCCFCFCLSVLVLCCGTVKEGLFFLENMKSSPYAENVYHQPPLVLNIFRAVQFLATTPKKFRLLSFLVMCICDTLTTWLVACLCVNLLRSKNNKVWRHMTRQRCTLLHNPRVLACRLT